MRIEEKSIVVFDLEWTSWPGYLESGFNQPDRHRDVVQIGAVRLDAADGFTETDAFQTLVRSVRHPQLSQYLIDLTGITQERVDSDGIPFPEALTRFTDFVGNGSTAFYSFGDDYTVLAENAVHHGIVPPPFLAEGRNLRLLFSQVLNVPEDSMVSSRMPALLGLPNGERAHDALGDSRCLASALRHLRGRGML